MADVLLHPDVEKHLQALPNDVEERIRDALEQAGERPGRELKPLRGRDEFSLRIGDRRAIIDWDASRDELRVLDVDTRDTVYD
jgi:mRNA-degrading endonuclease RelE of RelBE toxin-antitoxin system